MSQNFIAGDDMLDSRDLQMRIDELESDIETAVEKNDEEGLNDEEQSDLDDNSEELESLTEFRDEVASSEWDSGLTLISDDYFEDYARQFAEDIGAFSGSESWPGTCIDWKQAAEELQMDYSCADFDGTTYWYQG